jgi:phage-related protein
VKPARFVGTAREDLTAFPEAARRRAGHELVMVQVGRKPADFKPLAIVGSGTYEIRVRDETGAFRVMSVAPPEDAVYVLRLPEDRQSDRIVEVKMIADKRGNMVLVRGEEYEL